MPYRNGANAAIFCDPVHKNNFSSNLRNKFPGSLYPGRQGGDKWECCLYLALQAKNLKIIEIFI